MNKQSEYKDDGGQTSSRKYEKKLDKKRRKQFTKDNPDLPPLPPLPPGYEKGKKKGYDHSLPLPPGYRWKKGEVKPPKKKKSGTGNHPMNK